MQLQYTTKCVFWKHYDRNVCFKKFVNNLIQKYVADRFHMMQHLMND